MIQNFVSNLQSVSKKNYSSDSLCFSSYAAKPATEQQNTVRPLGIQDSTPDLTWGGSQSLSVPQGWGGSWFTAAGASNLTGSDREAEL